MVFLGFACGFPVVFLWSILQNNGTAPKKRHLQELLSAIVEAGAALLGQLAHVLQQWRLDQDGRMGELPSGND